MEHTMLKSLVFVNLPTPIVSNSFCVPFFNHTCFNKFKLSACSNPSSSIDDDDSRRKPIKKWVSFLLGNDSSAGYLQNGGLGMALLSAATTTTATARVRMSPLVATLALNPTFVSWILAWFVAQSMKVMLTLFVERRWDIRIMFSSGGMPSSHSALCTALTTSVAICHGVADALFPVCLGFSLIVMYDAIGVRRHAGMQAEVLNVIVGDLFQGHPIGKRKLKELLGHTLSQVVVGAILGFVVAIVCCQSVLVPT